jgi:hypothetical protein
MCMGAKPVELIKGEPRESSGHWPGLDSETGPRFRASIALKLCPIVQR